MLTAKHVRATRRSGQLVLSKMDNATKERALALASQYVAVANQCVGQTRAFFEDAIKAVSFSARDKKMAEGLVKLVDDRSEFEKESDVDSVALRRGVFQLAALRRRQTMSALSFDRAGILLESGGNFKLSAGAVDKELFADLKDEQILLTFGSISPESLVELYEQSQGQAVLLRAAKVTVVLTPHGPLSLRYFFQKLKFLRLIHVITPLNDGRYQVVIDGPISLFSAGTKYGLQLALLLPTLCIAGQWHLNADILWGKEKQALTFAMESHIGGSSVVPREPMDESLVQFLKQFEKQESSWHPSVNTEVLELPGVSLCVPDIVFTNSVTGEVAYLEVMGFWSRAAVWRRVELVEAGLSKRIIFAVSSRLRVSEEVLPDDAASCLYVYKGALSAGAVLRLLERK